MKIWRNLAIMFFLLFSVENARAFFAQDMSSALSYNNVGRNGRGNAKPAVAGFLPGYATYGGDMNVDKSGIADKIIGKVSPQALVVDFRSKKTTLQAAIPNNYIFYVVLPQQEGSRWIIDSKNEFLEKTESKNDNDILIQTFRTLKSGQTTVYFDKMTTEAPYKSLQSKVLRIRIE